MEELASPAYDRAGIETHACPEQLPVCYTNSIFKKNFEVADRMYFLRNLGSGLHGSNCGRARASETLLPPAQPEAWADTGGCPWASHSFNESEKSPCIKVLWTVALTVIVVSWSHLITNKRHVLTNSYQGFLLKYIATKEEKKQNRNSAYWHLRTMLPRTSPTLNVSALWGECP